MTFSSPLHAMGQVGENASPVRSVRSVHTKILSVKVKVGAALPGPMAANLIGEVRWHCLSEHNHLVHIHLRSMNIGLEQRL
jgi:hypothetical protein